MKELFINGVGWIEVPAFRDCNTWHTGPFTAREDKILAALYFRYGSNFTARALNRSQGSVFSRAGKLGIKGKPSKKKVPGLPDTLGRVA